MPGTTGCPPVGITGTRTVPGPAALLNSFAACRCAKSFVAPAGIFLKSSKAPKALVGTF